ncbi:BTAD domain-containing putative transcriptional regulator [Sphaerimonospora cavernae]|uniref:BTAD domain-containing putative transcriptional regulator n=1 Tax=Sphaerimonospora cavernae TaxID=1740611 RepID=A0ABV6TYK1_9ACTN
MGSLFFRLFGHFEVVSGSGEQLDLGSRKQRAVLALLALEPGRTVSLDRLIDEIWAGEAPSSATGSLQAYISHLRRVLEPGRAPRTSPKVLLTREPGYVLAIAPRQVDLSCFISWAEEGRRATAQRRYGDALEVLDRALALWRGEPLAEFAGFDFAQPVITGLAESRVTAAENWFEARLALGDSGSCVAELERMVEAHPYRERSWGLLVLALYRAGRQADALGALRRVRTLLAGGLGIEPGPELRRLERAVFDQSERLDAPEPPNETVAAPAVRISAEQAPGEPVRERAGGTEPNFPLSASEPLIARAGHLTRITERLSDVRRGRGGVMLVTGEAGMGKTRLAQAVAEDAEARGITVIWGRCMEGDAAPPFWPWLQALRALGESGTDAVRLLAGEGEETTVDPDAALFELYEQVLSALNAVCSPVLLVFDDLHSADASSLRLLAFMASELRRASILVLATLRPEPGTDPEQLSETLAALAREPGTERMSLPPFTHEDVAAFLAQRDLTDPALAQVLYERTGGNPFYLRELVRLLGSEHRLNTASLGVPEGVRDVIGRRVARLPGPTRELLGSAAVLGRDVGLDLLEAFTDISAEELMTRLEPAVATGLLIETPGFDYRFSHVLVRDTLYAGLGRLEQARLHLRAGEALESLPGGDRASRLSMLARHFAVAAKVGGAGKAVDYATKAARQATAQRAYDESVELWNRALAALGRGEPHRRVPLLIELGRALRDVGDVEQAYVALDEAVGLASHIGDREAVVEAVTVFGGLTIWYWRPYGVVDDHTVALLERLLEEPLDDPHRAAVLGTLGLEFYFGPRREEGERLAAEAVAIARDVGDPGLLGQVLNDYVLVTAVPGRERQRRRAIEEMLAVPGLPIRAEIIARSLRMAESLKGGSPAGWSEDRARTERLLRKLACPELIAMFRITEAAHATLYARWSEAERLAGEATALLDGSTLWGMDFPERVTVFTCRRAQGRVGEIVDGLIARADEAGMEPLRPVAVLAALDSGDTELARSLVDRWGTAIRDDWSAEFLTVVWGYVAVRLGVPDPAALYRRLEPYGDRMIGVGTGMAVWGSTHQVLAELAAVMGDTGLARVHARRAHETHTRLGLDYWAGESARLVTRLGGECSGVNARG